MMDLACKVRELKDLQEVQRTLEAVMEGLQLEIAEEMGKRMHIAQSTRDNTSALIALYGNVRAW
ncbi:hypothetical protein LJC63_12340 [Ruminococcaceae bacterium OttesenSCG-928-L11]|nr:hypothetical protein [Ruminococcaceae bacterium OttesenSCG-928-L11]